MDRPGQVTKLPTSSIWPGPVLGVREVGIDLPRGMAFQVMRGDVDLKRDEGPSTSRNEIHEARARERRDRVIPLVDFLVRDIGARKGEIAPPDGWKGGRERVPIWSSRYRDYWYKIDMCSTVPEWRIPLGGTRA